MCVVLGTVCCPIDEARAQTAPATVPAITHGKATANGTRLHYLKAGQGQPVVLIHGNPETSATWRKVMPALASRYTVIAPDLRGLGDSDPATTGYDKKTLAEDVYQLMRGQGYTRFAVVGHDFGGSIAYALAARHPESVTRLAVIEALPAGLLTDEAEAKALAARLDGRTWFQAFGRVAELPEQLVKGREDVYLGWLYDNYSATPGVPSRAERAEYLRTYRKPGRMTASFNLYRTAPQDQADNAGFLQTKLTVPTLAVGGDKCMGSAVASALRSGCTDVQAVVLAGCGHFVPEEKPDELTRLLLTFLREGAGK